MAFRVGKPKKLGMIGLFDPDNYMDKFGNHMTTDPNAPRRYYTGFGGGYGQDIPKIFKRPRNQLNLGDGKPDMAILRPLEPTKTPEQMEEERRPGTYFGSDEMKQKQFNLDTYTKAPPGVLFGEDDSRFETPAMRVARREAGDLRGPGMGSSLFGQNATSSGASNNIDQRLIDGFGEDAAKLPATGPRSRIGKYGNPGGTMRPVSAREPSNLSLGLPSVFGG